MGCRLLPTPNHHPGLYLPSFSRSAGPGPPASTMLQIRNHQRCQCTTSKETKKRKNKNERTNPIVMQYRAMVVNVNKWSYPLVICGLYSLVSKFVATSEFHRWRFLFHMNNTSSQQCHQNSWIDSSNEVVRKKHTNGLCINNCNNLTNPYKSLHNTTTDRSEQTKSTATNWLVDYRLSDELATWLTD